MRISLAQYKKLEVLWYKYNFEDFKTCKIHDLDFKVTIGKVESITFRPKKNSSLTYLIEPSGQAHS